ncbi:hypothetical protein HanPSC8_Chr16g0746151 [Helianthus annuus]|nr:hypothetical protein HanPSC8_Chr16g0746151 [Helianthus annuus]
MVSGVLLSLLALTSILEFYFHHIFINPEEICLQAPIKLSLVMNVS